MLALKNFMKTIFASLQTRAAFLLVTVLGGRLLTTSTPAQEPLPAPWVHQDIGAAQVPGTARYAAGAFILQGTMDLWGTSDGSHIAFQPWRGDVELVARVTAMDNPGGVAHAKAGLCIRESTAAGSGQVTMCVTPTDGTQFLVRVQTGGATTSQKTGLNRGTMP